jgi:hypothetical protein
VPTQLVDGGLPIARGKDVVVAEAPAQLALDAGVVLNDQEFSGALAHAAMLP